MKWTFGGTGLVLGAIVGLSVGAIYAERRQSEQVAPAVAIERLRTGVKSCTLGWNECNARLTACENALGR